MMHMLHNMMQKYLTTPNLPPTLVKLSILGFTTAIEYNILSVGLWRLVSSCEGTWLAFPSRRSLLR